MRRARLRIPVLALASVAVLSLSACSGGTTSTSPTPTPTPVATSPYTAKSVLLLTSTAIYTYPLSGDGTPATINVTPTATLTAPTGVQFSAMAQDSAGNLYVGAYLLNSLALEILVYPAGSTGAATPSRTITGSSTQLTVNLTVPQTQVYGLTAVTVDSTGQIYATMGPTILAFAPGANGNVAPSRVITGSNTGLFYATALAVDTADNLLANNMDASMNTGETLQFAPSANGNVAPTRKDVALMSFSWGLDIDASNNAFVSDTSGGGLVYEFPAGSSTASRSFSTLVGTGGRSYESFWGLRQDKSGYTFVSVELNNGNSGIQVFAPTASGSSSVVTFATPVLFSRYAQILLR